MDMSDTVASRIELDNDCASLTLAASRISKTAGLLAERIEAVNEDLRALRLENERLMENERDLLRVSTVVRVQKENDALRKELDEKRCALYEMITYKKTTYYLEKKTGKVFARKENGERGECVGKQRVKIVFSEAS